MARVGTASRNIRNPARGCYTTLRDPYGARGPRRPLATLMDDRLLEQLHDDEDATAGQLATATGAPIETVHDRLRLLAQVELVDAEREGDTWWWDLTIWGVRYLEGAVDVEKRPRPDPRGGFEAPAL